MSFSKTDLTKEIKSVINKRVDEGLSTPAPWIVSCILANHPVRYDEDTIGTSKCDSSYAELARQELAWTYVRKVLRQFKKPTPDLPTLPGFKHLQKAYSCQDSAVEEDDSDLGNVVIVPVDQLSDDQLLAKAEQYEKMGDGCYEHAAELRRFVRIRRKAA